MTPLEIVLIGVIGVLFPSIWYLQKRINDIEKNYADRQEINTNIRELKRDMEGDMKEIKQGLGEIYAQLRQLQRNIGK